MIVKEELKLTQEWDKTFPRSDKVSHSKVSFINRYGITLAADLYLPKSAAGKPQVLYPKRPHMWWLEKTLAASCVKPGNWVSPFSRRTSFWSC